MSQCILLKANNATIAEAIIDVLTHSDPRLDLVTREIIGAEALVRWRRPQRGRISPAQFIPIAEGCGQSAH